MDMREDLFAVHTFGKVALQKIASKEPNFRLYIAGIVNDKKKGKKMRVTGAVFREPTQGPNKGTLSIMVPKSSRTVYVTSDEVKAFESASPP